MKTLENHTLLYDEDCPLCTVYTSGFIKSKMLDSNGRKPFSELQNDKQANVDMKRAINEIALVNTKDNTVTYGIDSLLKVIGTSFPIIEKIGHQAPVHYMLSKLYSFISYNRKVIVPSNKERETSCVPDFNYRYRFLYIIFTILITTVVLFEFSNSITMLSASSIQREFIITLGQIILQYLFLTKVTTEKYINYIGNLMTVSLIGSILLMLLLGLNMILKLPQNAVFIGFGLTVLFMFFEHKRRVEILKLPMYLSYTWVLYRIIVLLIILNT